MTATKMNAQEIIQFIANAEKKTSVKVAFLQRFVYSIWEYTDTGVFFFERCAVYWK